MQLCNPGQQKFKWKDPRTSKNETQILANVAKWEQGKVLNQDDHGGLD